MTSLTKSTIKMICVKSGIARKEITEEAQHLLDLYNDPKIDDVAKADVKRKLDNAIKVLEERVTTRRLREDRRIAGLQPPAP